MTAYEFLTVLGTFLGPIIGVLTAVYLVRADRRKENKKYPYILLLLFPVGLIVFYYMIVLSGSVKVFYFPAPYKDPTNVFVSLTSYIPFLLLMLILPYSVVNYRLLKNNSWGYLGLGLFTLNNLIYIILIGLFAYWKFYDIFN